jgi:predicted Fe-S protein YdhL (DUF1289 family)
LVEFESRMPIETPCIKICSLDPQSRLCTGCGRTLEEIARWGSMDESERRRVMTSLPQRLEKAKQTV